jgi:hypothetical protein
MASPIPLSVHRQPSSFGGFLHAATCGQISAFVSVHRLFGKTIHTDGLLSGNYWTGSRTVQFRIIDAAKA